MPDIDPDTPKGPEHDPKPEMPALAGYVLAMLYAVAFFWLPLGLFIYWWVAVR